MKQNCILTLLFSIVLCPAFGQISLDASSLSDIELLKDTSIFSWNGSKILYGGGYHVPFEYQEESEVLEVRVYFRYESGIEKVDLLPSSDFEVLDSIFLFENYARFKVKFRELSTSDRMKFSFLLKHSNESDELVDVPLLPFTQTYATYYPPEGGLYVGEEIVTEITTNHPENIIIDERWTEGLPINYRMRKRGQSIILYLSPNQLGTHEITVPIKLKRPMIRDGSIQYTLPDLKNTFTVRAGRLTFLKMDQQEVTPNDDRKTPVEVQIENHETLQLGKTYRLEDREEIGGALIGELFTKTRLNNNKVLCLFRPYAFHRKSEGYLYLKDGDRSLFVTSVDVTPKTKIESIHVLREGKDWEKTNKVHPGEQVAIKFEGQGMHKANFRFLGVDFTLSDSLLRNEKFVFFDIKIPNNIRTEKIEIFNRGENTGSFLSVTEHQLPRDFDFVSLELGVSQTYTLNEITRPIYFEENLSDLVISFNRSMIDENNEFYGPQHLTIKLKISNKLGNLIELYQFDDIVICPDNSLREAHYDAESCFSGNINLNNYISKKTYNLDEWSKIELEISHVSDEYSKGALKKKTLIYLKKNHHFDIDVSFPGGLLILKAGSNDFDNFSGVSFAMMGEFSFYQNGKIARLRPYKLGAGFIAIDAFNFSENADDRDVGLVIVGSVHPAINNPNSRLTFPLYIGFGYLMKEQKLFSLIGPGIRVRL